MAHREVATFPFAPSMREKLLRAGFRTLRDILELTPVQLSQELDCALDEALALLQAAQQADRQPVPQGVSAVELLQREVVAPRIRTGSSDLDDLLHGGIPAAKLTEFCGAPGVGKTQLGCESRQPEPLYERLALTIACIDAACHWYISIQLAINVQLPRELGGAGGEAIYIDTEGSFIVERVAEIAESTIAQLAEAAGANGLAPASVTVEALLGGIRYYRVHDHIEQVALLNLLDGIVHARPQIKLVVLDSIAFHFRYDFGDMGLRSRLLNGMSQTLIKLAHKHQLAVVLMNQMTTKVRAGDGDGQSALVPALGDSWGHACTIRAILSWRATSRAPHREAYLLKSPAGAQRSVSYAVTAGGIRNATMRPAAPAEDDGDAESDASHKRARLEVPA